MRAALLFIALLVAAPAAAEDCAKYASALAYNACLARRGPAARTVHVHPAPVGHARSRHAHARHASARRMHAHRGRRSTKVFTVKK